MKTYSLLCSLVAFVAMGCSTSEDTSTIPTENEVEETSYDADYALLQKSNGQLSVQSLKVTDSGIDLSEADSTFESTPSPELTFRQGSIFAYYTKVTDCDGQVTLHDFEDNESRTLDVFEDLLDCSLMVSSIAFDADNLYVAYTKEETSKIDKYYVRILDLSSEVSNAIDIELDKKPVQMAIANARLFVLTLDLDVTNEYELSIVNLATKAVIHEKGLGYNVGHIFTDTQDQIIISYKELHTVLNSSTFGVKYVNYDTATAPGFYGSENNCFDESGRMFYIKTSDSNPIGIPAVYDFSNNLVLLYIYSNFLTASELEFEFKIGQASMVSYDNENHVLIVGYQKSDDENKGGLLRIQLEPEPKFLDNLDLNAVPYQFFYKD